MKKITRKAKIIESQNDWITWTYNNIDYYWKTNDFDANLNKAKGSVNGFQGGIMEYAKTAGASDEVCRGYWFGGWCHNWGFRYNESSSQTLGDEYARTMDGLKGGVDQFFLFYIGGDWPYERFGWNNTFSLCDAYDAMDQLGNTECPFLILTQKSGDSTGTNYYFKG